MATTANGTPYVESSDLVANYPAVSLALAEHIDDNTGKVLQVVRATDATLRSTTSSTYVDASISVTITPQRIDSTILVIWSFVGTHVSTSDFSDFQITDSSNVALSGAEAFEIGSNTTNTFVTFITGIGFSTPGTIAATTYKGRFRRSSSGTAQIANGVNTGQLYAIEVSA
jgi:hypothetical protein